MHFVPLSSFLCFKVRCLDRPVSGNNRLLFLEDFSDHSYSRLFPSTKSPLIIAISFAILEQSESRVILSFVFAGQARRVLCIVISINSAPTQMIDGTEKPIRSLQRAARYNEFGYKSSYPKKYLPKFSYPRKSFDHPFHLKSGVLFLALLIIPKKSLDQNLTPKKSHAKFLSPKNYQALSDIPRKIFKIKHSQNNACRDTQALPRIFRGFEYPLLRPATKKKTLFIAPT